MNMREAKCVEEQKENHRNFHRRISEPFIHKMAFVLLQTLPMYKTERAERENVIIPTLCNVAIISQPSLTISVV